MKNLAIREHAKEKGVKLWQIAERLYMWESALSRKMRHELPAEEQSRIMCIIDEIAKEAENAD